MKIDNKKQLLTIVKTIKQQRLLQGYSQVDLARKIGVHRNTIQSLEAGKFYISTQRLIAVCNFLNIKLIC